VDAWEKDRSASARLHDREAEPLRHGDRLAELDRHLDGVTGQRHAVLIRVPRAQDTVPTASVVRKWNCGR
jgi:hypothetical protein